MQMTRREFQSLALFALTAGVASPGRLLRAAQPQASESESRVFHWREIPGRPGFHAAMGQGGNALLVVSGDRAVLVDAKNAGFGAILRAEAEAFGVTLDALINTHHHADHTGGNNAFTNDLPVLAHDNVPARVRAQMDRYRQAVRSLAQDPTRLPAPLRSEVQGLADRIDDARADEWAPTRTVGGAGDSREMRVGSGETILLRPMGPAHTDGDMAVLFADADVLHTGDLLFHKLHPFIDMGGGASIDGWIGACDGLLKLCTPRTVVVPGHGEITDREGLREQRRYLETLRDFTKREIERGVEREAFLEMVVPGFQDYGFEQFRPRVMSAAYDAYTSG